LNMARFRNLGVSLAFFCATHLAVLSMLWRTTDLMSTGSKSDFISLQV
jgi:hypothetical protein